MATTFTKNTFGVTYKDDFADSDNYHRILFNSGRAVQARELTQAQTITQVYHSNYLTRLLPCPANLVPNPMSNGQMHTMRTLLVVSIFVTTFV